MSQHPLWDDDLTDLVRIVAAYVRRRVEDADADDIVSDVFVKAVEATRNGTTPDRVRPWLLTIARNAVIDHYRSRDARNRAHQRLASITASATPAPRLPDDPELAIALSRLSGRDRELLLLVGWEQLDHAEIAQVLDISKANVSVRLHRARSRLRALLDTPPDPQQCVTAPPSTDRSTS